MQNVLISHTALRLPAVGLALVFLMGASVALHAMDYSLIEKLPGKVAAAKAQSAKGWDSGITADMKEASYQYNKALVVLMKDLSAAYYEPDVLPPGAIDDYLKALYTTRRFVQNVTNPKNESLGTIAGLDVLGEVTSDLEKSLTDMVEAIVADDPKFKAADWRKKWMKALAP